MYYYTYNTHILAAAGIVGILVIGRVGAAQAQGREAACLFPASV